MLELNYKEVNREYLNYALIKHIILLSGLLLLYSLGFLNHLCLSFCFNFLISPYSILTLYQVFTIDKPGNKQNSESQSQAWQDHKK